VTRVGARHFDRSLGRLDLDHNIVDADVVPLVHPPTHDLSLDEALA
jgi:hypothetical protein